MLIFCFIVATAQEKVIVVAGNTWPPFVDPKNPKGGISLELIKAVYKTQGYVVEMKNLPWARAEAGVKKGKYDILLNVWKNSEREKDLLFSKAFASNKIKFIKLKDDNFEYNGLESLEGKKIGVVRGYGYLKQLRRVKNVKLDEVTDFSQNIKKLLSSRIDLTIEDEIVAKMVIEQTDPKVLNKISFTKKSFLEMELHVAAGYKNPRNKEMIKAFNKGLELIIENGTFEEIMKNYK